MYVALVFLIMSKLTTVILGKDELIARNPAGLHPPDKLSLSAIIDMLLDRKYENVARTEVR